MKIEESLDAYTKRQCIKSFLLEHPDEVFTLGELLRIFPGAANNVRHCSGDWIEKVDRTHNVYGCPEAIGKLRELKARRASETQSCCTT